MNMCVRIINYVSALLRLYFGAVPTVLYFVILFCFNIISIINNQ
jgi:hypothetical protein